MKITFTNITHKLHQITLNHVNFHGNIHLDVSRYCIKLKLKVKIGISLSMVE